MRYQVQCDSKGCPHKQDVEALTDYNARMMFRAKGWRIKQGYEAVTQCPTHNALSTVAA